MRAPTEILGIRYFLLGVIFTRTDTRVESSHQGTPQNKNKSFFLSFPDCQSRWAGSAYITLGVASAFGPDHYILPHITQKIQAASAFQARPHFISYPGAVTTLSRLQQERCFKMERTLCYCGKEAKWHICSTRVGWSCAKATDHWEAVKVLHAQTRLRTGYTPL